MTEQELQETLTDPEVRAAAHNLTCQALPAESEDEAAQLWTAVHIYAWLREWPGSQSALVRRVWYFWSDGRNRTDDTDGNIEHRIRGGDIDLFVGHNRRHDPFKVRVMEVGPTALRVRIVGWVNGVETVPWNRLGSVYTEPDQYVAIWTLPEGEGRRCRGRR